MLIEKIKSEKLNSYKNREMEKKDFLAVLETEVTKESKQPTDDYVIGKIKSMIKNAEATSSLNEMELDILNSYLPKQFNSDELENIISNYINDNPSHNMGQIMQFLKASYSGQYDGKLASELAKKVQNIG